jgi:hypothetical protein
MTFSPTGVLYAWYEFASAFPFDADGLCTIDLTTGTPTQVGPSGQAGAVLHTAVAFNPNGQLYLKYGDFSGGYHVSELNPATGAVMSTVNITDGPTHNVFAFNASNTLAYTGLRSPGLFTYKTLDVLTGDLTDIGSNNIGNLSAFDFTHCTSATDNCGIEDVSYDPPSGSFFQVGTTVVTATATDINGNTATCTFNVIVNDEEDPTVTCKNLTVYLDASGMASITANQLVVSSDDNCAVVSTTLSDYDFTSADICPDAVDQQELGVTGTFGPNNGLSQTFTAGASGPLTKVRVAVGGPSATYTLQLLNGSNPNSSPVMASATVNGGPVVWQNVYFPMPPA